MGLLSLFFKNPLVFFAVAVPLLYSIILHEVAHGWVAYLFGDDTAKRSGRLSLNPAVHLDLFGTLALFIAGFGWAKPVPVNYYNFKNFRLGLICVSLAGCLTNIIIASVSVFLLQLEYVVSNTFLAGILLIVFRINVVLGAFNLIPIPPLDGSKILMGLLPEDAQRNFMRFEQFGILLLLFLIFTGFLNPVIAVMQRVIVTLITTLTSMLR